MASGIYNRAFYNLATGALNWPAAGTAKVALLGPGYVFNKDHNNWSSISSNEITGTGYTTGGRSILSPTVSQDDAGDKAKIDAADVTWATATMSATGAAIRKASGGDLVCFYSFGTVKIASTGNFTLQFNSTGLFTLAQA